METWFLILIISISIAIASLLKPFSNVISFHPTKQSPNLPPGPRPLPIIGNLLLFRKSFNGIKPIIQSLHAKYGPIITLHFGSRPVIFIADRFLAHQAIVKEGANISDRPPTFNGNNQKHVSTAFYGAKWRLLRRNLTDVILQSSGLKTYSHAREWALETLLNRLKLQSKSGDCPVEVVQHFDFSIFSLIVLMCFGEKYEDKAIKEIEDVVERMVSSFGRASMIYMTSIWPTLTKFVFHKVWAESSRIEQQQKELFSPLIKERIKKRKKGHNQLSSSSYLDKLLDLHLPEENRSLNEDEIVALCSELLSGGSHTTTAALEWIMANLVKYPRIQNKLFMEIKGVMGEKAEKLVKEDDLSKIPYLRAVILETLRRQPLAPFMLPHVVTNDVILDRYVVPKDWTVFIMNGDMGLDPEVWEDPMEFKPERFLSDEDGEKSFGMDGDKEIKMMPFGAGRRMCAGRALAMLHLEYFVANLVWCFEWKAMEGDEVDLEPKQGLAVTMKNPLKAHLLPRY